MGNPTFGSESADVAPMGRFIHPETRHHTPYDHFYRDTSGLVSGRKGRGGGAGGIVESVESGQSLSCLATSVKLRSDVASIYTTTSKDDFSE